MYSDDYYVKQAMHTFANSGLIHHEYRGYCTVCPYKSRTSDDEKRISQLSAVHAYKKAHKVAIVDHGIGVKLIGHKDQSMLDEPCPF